MLHIIKTNSGFGWGDSAMSNTHCLFVCFIQKITKFFLEEQRLNSVQAAAVEDGLFVAV